MDKDTPEITTSERMEDAKLPFWRKRRYHVVVMIFLGFIFLYTLRVNLSVAVVAMTQTRNVTLEDGTVVEEQGFDWNSKQQGLILSAYFYGSITTHLLGGYLGTRFGGHLVFGISVVVCSVMDLLMPVLAKSHLALFVAARIIQGIFGGISFPSVMAIWSKWAPVYERSSMGNVTYTGIYIGGIIALLLSGVLAVKWGWESIFYFFGSLSFLWYIVWIFVVKASPEVDPFITDAEKRYILSSLGDSKKGKDIVHPWKDIFTSAPVWAIIVADLTAMWGTFTLLTQLPMFLSDTLHFDMDTTGIMSSIPYIALVCMLFVAGFLADWIQVKGYLRTGQIRRYFTGIPYLLQMVFMFLTAYTTNPTLCVVFITIGTAVGAFPWSGYVVSGLDIAPSHVSVITGFCGTLSTLAGIISPTLMGFIVTDKTREQWQIVFYISAGIYLFGAIFSLIFISGKLQPWAKIDQEKLALKKLEALSDEKN
ncbi:sialin-like isoform X2 [Lutzomyia longipalpis]|uniref:sialin-like isoform X2 n=1 Tax=Lutzomyia longipalpis TaxID=7200 RepID=UPI002483763E|nr:sialin-like isoform X2 [Lutzomyia longipalpis]